MQGKLGRHSKVLHTLLLRQMPKSSIYISSKLDKEHHRLEKPRNSTPKPLNTVEDGKRLISIKCYRRVNNAIHQGKRKKAAKKPTGPKKVNLPRRPMPQNCLKI